LYHQDGGVILEAGSVERGLSRGKPESLWRTVLAYFELTKPISVALLVFTGMASFVVASEGRFLASSFLAVLVALTAGCAGANAMTCYIDRDIDTVMLRTRRRPLPTGRIRPAERALWFGVALMLIGLTIAWWLGPLTFILGLLGLVDNVVIYSLLTKRRSRWNVLWGGISGGMPAAFGWAAASGSVDATALLIAALVVLWIPNHIWNLAIFYSDDYSAVHVPMLPVVCDLKVALRCVVTTVVLLYIVSVGLYFVGGFGQVYLLTAGLSGLALTLGNLYLAARPSRKLAWLMFKLSSPYLLVIFLAMMVDALVG